MVISIRQVNMAVKERVFQVSTNKAEIKGVLTGDFVAMVSYNSHDLFTNDWHLLFSYFFVFYIVIY